MGNHLLIQSTLALQRLSSLVTVLNEALTTEFSLILKALGALRKAVHLL